MLHHDLDEANVFDDVELKTAYSRKLFLGREIHQQSLEVVHGDLIRKALTGCLAEMSKHVRLECVSNQSVNVFSFLSLNCYFGLSALVFLLRCFLHVLDSKEPLEGSQVVFRVIVD